MRHSSPLYWTRKQQGADVTAPPSRPTRASAYIAALIASSLCCGHRRGRLAQLFSIPVSRRICINQTLLPRGRRSATLDAAAQWKVQLLDVHRDTYIRVFLSVITQAAILVEIDPVGKVESQMNISKVV
jgi:hypothetical protein